MLERQSSTDFEEIALMLNLLAKTTAVVARRQSYSLPNVLRQLRVVPLRFPLAEYHTTLALSVNGQPEGWTARILFLRKGDENPKIFEPLVHYMIENRTLCATWQNSLARGIGLFWDYCQVNAEPGDDDGSDFRGDLFDAFIQALLHGTMVRGRDDSGLVWPPTSRTQTKLLVNRMKSFCTWCEKKGYTDAVLGLPEFPDGVETGCRRTAIWSRLQEGGTFAHLASAAPIYRAASGALGQDPAGTRVQPVKSFPADRAEDLLKIGHRRPGSHDCDPEYLRFNIRDQMMALLDGWGGLRRSEGLHLWEDDVSLDARTGEAHVTLGHPVWHRKAYVEDGRRFMASRRYILGRRYAILPRSQVKRGRYHVGWKGMDLDKAFEERVHWRDHDKGVEFWRLYLVYVKKIRDRIMLERLDKGGYDHPFLFVSEATSGGGAGRLGDPYSMQAYERNHAAAVERLDLEHNKGSGTTTHGLRHLYGRTLMRRNVPPDIIRLGLHHRTMLAQAPYTVRDWSESNDLISDRLRTSTISEAERHERHGSPGSQQIGRLADAVRMGKNHV